jgi:hypothetical protein
MLTDVYKSSSEPADREVTDEQSKRATMEYRLLQSLKTLPGMGKGGDFNTAALHEWVTTVRNLAAQVDRVEVADHQIGRLLGYAPADTEDESWPHRAIRDLLEELRSEDIESSMVSEQVNKRGAGFRGVFEGGAKERSLAAQAREWAQVSRQWPRTSAMLTRIAEMWDRYAKREDEDAEKRKIQLE